MAALQPKTLIEQYFEMWNDADFSKIDSLMHPDLLFQCSMNLDKSGIEAFREYTQIIHKAFPDLYHTAEMVLSEGHQASAYVLYAGTHKGKLFDLEPTGNRILYNGAIFFTVNGDKFSKIRVFCDRYTLFNQLQTADKQDQ
jgi:predicted ester cyclase